MKINSYKILFGCIALAGILSSCEKSETISTNEQSKEYIDAWVGQNYPGATQTSLGVYILEDTPGNGDIYNGEDYVFVNYSVKSMTGTISSTTVKKIAQQIGTYDSSYYYGENTWYTGNDNLAVGIEDMLSGMRVGETRTALVPSWLMVTERKENPEDYIKKTNSRYSTSIYEITLEGFTDNILQSQIERIEKYCDKVYGGADSLTYGFYYKELAAPSDTTSFPSDTTIKINYTGRLLNGQVFDTSIKDTAKKYSIYDSSTTYGTSTITWGENASALTIKTAGSSSSLSMITGFQYLLWNMRHDGKSAGIFVSQLGYGSSGSGNRIPAYAPLVFEIEIVDE